MKTRTTLFFAVLLFCLTASGQKANAQISLKDLLNSKSVQNIVGQVTGNSGLKFESFIGTWEYLGPACSLESDNILKDVGGQVVTAEVEKKLEEMAKKAGLTAGKFSVTFNSDSTFSSTISSKKALSGKYRYDPKTNILTLRLGAAKGNLALSTMEAKVEKSGNNIKLLFNASKLKDYLAMISSVVNVTSLQTLSTLLQSYDGLGVGCELKKK